MNTTQSQPTSADRAAPELASLVRELLAAEAVRVLETQARWRALAGMLMVAVLAVTGAVVIGYRTQAWAWVIAVVLNTGSLIYGVSLWTSIDRWAGYIGRLIDRLEAISQMDINGDGRIPEPIKSTRIQVMINDDKGLVEGRFIDLPASKEQLRHLAIGVLTQGRKFSEREWTGQNGRLALFTQGEFEALQKEMIARGLAAPANPRVPNSRVELTRVGAGVLKHYLPQPGAAALPYPTEGGE